MPDTANISLDKMRATAGEVSQLLRSIGNQDRLLLLCQLSQEELNVSQLESRLGIHQPSLSQQLGVLRREGLVSTRREGKHIYYRIADERVLALLQTLYELYCEE
ncbi:ArsR/SmtB family transcription factor [Microbulbifer thermotolerans]|uniref:Metalloregulator ArsR/SmtB family transcription factor n=1 Tax=Microbulbifer thermotolerans TaxID=252514 RepID=A0A143HLW1_MICTH|nr:metalloregulator ArsR/SmtB family transcription factor [Microbulbifer thermotolerans]AMX02715.1 transcriptional regulator [Microbulbifer thermotolerans]MCX2779568.1 metalloregulator ArsR/SmtB family transcription factor [Microbulbifer thermotolerans]MCX2782533.1 metalloregulator ArsR/SmtB family transcription factor [Microbulbifer thermotolerans]MCX2794546.1 metalloregulator ArsR/SmtB family transcription factor [Microbulbifer thermotolerans]MCX2801373.1 metalloregulator ArsR/SmtB family tr